MNLDERHKVTKKVTLVGAFTNFTLSVLQMVFGLLGHSQALFADGIHTLSDLVSDFIVLFASGKASQQADEEHPFGHARIETLASVLLGMILFFVGVSIAIRGTYSLYTNSVQQPEALALLFAAVGIALKEFLYRYTVYHAKKIHSTLLESNAWHHRSDALSSLIVFVGIGGQLLGIPYLDVAAAFIVAGFIIKMGLNLAFKAFKELIDTALEPELIENIHNTITSINGVYGIHQLRTRSMGGLGYIDVDLEVNPKISVSEGHYIAGCVEQKVKHDFPQIKDVKIHIDPYGEEDAHHQISQLPPRSKLLFNLYSAWSKVEESDNIKNINIHYHSNSIEVDIILPMSFASDEHREDIQNLKEITLSNDYIEKINIYFA